MSSSRCRWFACLLVVPFMAVACGDDAPTSPSTVGPGASGAPPAGASASLGRGPASFGDSRSVANPRGFSSPGRSSSPDPDLVVNAAYPGVVQNLTGRQIAGPNAAQLWWNPPITGAAVGSYQIVRELQESKIVYPSDCVLQGGETVCTVVWPDGLSHDTHRFTVYARNATEGGGPTSMDAVSAMVFITIGPWTEGSAPGVVRNLAASQVSGKTDVIVSWDTPAAQSGVASSTSYTLAGGSSSVSVLAASCTETRTRPDCSHTLVALDAGSYTFSVSAINADGTGDASTVSLTVAVAEVPGAVRLLAAKQTGTTQSVVLSWESPSAGLVTAYTVGGDGSSLGTVQSSACTMSGSVASCAYTASAVSYGSRTFTVAAVNATGTGVSSSVTLDVQRPLTAVFSGVPGSHGGLAFTVTVTFSENPRVGFRAMRSHVFEVYNGYITRARRVTRGSNVSWLVTLRPITGPSSSGAARLPAGLRLRPTATCGTLGAVCTADGRPQTSDVSVSVRW